MDVRKQLHGAEITVTGVDTNGRLRCPDDCRDRLACPLCRLCDRPGSPEIRLALVGVTVANVTKQPFSLPIDGWELVDEQGYATGGAAVCERLLPVDHVQADLWSVSPNTRVRTMLAFPLGAGVRELICSDGEDSVRFPIAPAHRKERLKGQPSIRVKKRGRVCITECWSVPSDVGRQYVFVGRKK